jgi:hypothetical protein
MKYYVFSTIMCIGEIDKSSNIIPHKVPYMLMNTISGTTHTKMIFSF